MILLCGGKSLLDQQEEKHTRETMYPTVIAVVQDDTPERVAIHLPNIVQPFAVRLLDKDLYKIKDHSHRELLCSIQVTKIIIVKGNGPDKLSLFTTLPCGIFPFTGEQDLNMSVAAGAGEEYVKQHFPGVPVEVVTKR